MSEQPQVIHINFQIKTEPELKCNIRRFRDPAGCLPHIVPDASVSSHIHTAWDSLFTSPNSVGLSVHTFPFLILLLDKSSLSYNSVIVLVIFETQKSPNINWQHWMFFFLLSYMKVNRTSKRFGLFVLWQNKTFRDGWLSGIFIKDLQMNLS